MALSVQPHPCLWCGATRYAPSREHIVPEALGCPEALVLTEGVCERCNNGLGHVDQALVRQFEVQTVMNGIRRKKGKPPTISGWGPLRGKHGPEGPSIHLNAGPGDVMLDGRPLKALGGETGIHSFSMTRDGPEAIIRFSMDIGRDPKLLRALYKIGLEMVALYHGPAVALETRFDRARAFVTNGCGLFDALILDAETGGDHQFVAPFAEGDSMLAPIALFGVGFILDLTPMQPGLARAEERLRAEQGSIGWARLAGASPRSRRRPG